MRFEGIYTPLVTPYHDDFSVNEDALADTVELLIGAGRAWHHRRGHDRRILCAEF